MHTILRGLGRDTGYAVSSLLLGLVAFAVATCGLALGIGLLVLAGAALAARGLAQAERARAAVLPGVVVQPRTYAVAREGDGWWRRQLTPLRQGQSWLDLLWCVLGMVTSLVAFVVTVAWWAAAGGGLTYWFWQRWLPEPDGATLASLLGFGDGRRAESLVMLVIGVLALLTLPLAVRAAAGLHRALGATLLAGRDRWAPAEPVAAQAPAA